MDTIGALVDKLAIANIRLWHLEDRRRDRTLPDADRLRAADLVSAVNAERNALIDAIDRLVDEAIRSGNAPLSPKNKLYGL
jgi:hypothetical protein